MKRLLEWIFGLNRGFLNQEGDLYIQFHPRWPGQDALDYFFTKIGFGPIGAAVWNVALIALAIALVVYVYRREGRSRGARISLAAIRLAILGFVIALLNMPVFTIGQSRTEPSVLALLVDDTISMRVKDVQATGGEPVGRLDAILQLLKADDQTFIKDLAKTHILRFYRFDRQATPVISFARDKTGEKKDESSTAGVTSVTLSDPANVLKAFDQVKPEGQTTQVLASLRSAIEDLQGQRLAGVVVLTDGRDSPKEMVPEGIAALKNYGVKIYPVVVGSEKAPKNLTLEAINVQDAAFEGDIVNIKATVRAVGYEAGHRVRLQAIDKRTGAPLRRADGRPVEKELAVEIDKPTEVELQWKPDRVETVDIDVVVAKEPGELDDQDNVRSTQVAVLDAKLNVLYVDGYPRWDYRYLKNEMVRDPTVNISCLLTSADPTFAQEGDPVDEKAGFPGPIKRFPESIEEILKYDVILFGDVDPRQFTDAQLQLVKDFVSKRGGGFGMVAGPRNAPVSFKNTALEELLPVFISRVQEGKPNPIKDGFRPELTKDGQESSIFRFFEDRQRNEEFIKNEIQPVFWFCQGVQVKPGVGEVYAQHPTATAPDGRKSPILVLGRYGAGRTLFSAIDDSWRWRFYTGEAVFDTYWVQQFRYLARSKKLGQRKITFQSFRPAYELGDQVRLSLKVLDPQLLTQLPEVIPVEINNAADGKPAYRENMVKQEGQVDLYMASYTADKIGKFQAKLPPIAGGVESMELPFEVNVPKLELNQPQVDRQLLTRLAAETNGRTYDFEQAKTRLAGDIPSAAKQIPVEISEPLWNKANALWIFVLLITVEWVLRKAYGML
ncbi:MAG TPA: hypothetical protein VH475_24610, partial [Tepidisphaeraceae bacterium]|jgi:uncharacterized membrane protein